MEGTVHTQRLPALSSKSFRDGKSTAVPARTPQRSLLPGGLGAAWLLSSVHGPCTMKMQMLPGLEHAMSTERAAARHAGSALGAQASSQKEEPQGPELLLR